MNKAELDLILSVLRANHKDVGGLPTDYSYDHSPEGHRLARDNGSRWVSPRLNKREMYQWIGAYIEGIIAGRAIEVQQ